MNTIANFHQVLRLLPRYELLSNGEVKSPCPFCQSGSPHHIVNDVHFYGDDRLVIFDHRRSVYCRYCDNANRGRNGRGSYSMEQFIQRLNGKLDAAADFINEDFVREEKPLSSLWTQWQVDKAYERVNRSYWHSRGLSDATIDRFKLGVGRLYSRHEEDGHLIPLKVERYGEDPFDLYYMAYRLRHVKEHSPGSSAPYMAVHIDEPDATTVAITEGETDFLTAYDIGYRNIVSVFGATNWDPKKMQLLVDKGFEHVVCLVDGGQAGNALRQQIIRDAHRFGLSAESIFWDGRDSDLNEIHIEEDDTKAWLNEHLLAHPLPDAMRSSIRVLDNPNQERDIVSISDLRGDGPKSIRRTIEMFHNAYDFSNRGKGEALVLAAGAGAGKTYTTLKYAEEIARRHMQLIEEKREQLQRDLDDIIGLDSPDFEDRVAAEDLYHRVKSKLDDLDYNAVDWYSQYKDGYEDLLAAGANPALIYNYEARNSDNCKSSEIVGALGTNNHEIGRYCRTSCPFFKECSQEGYMAQEGQAKKFPIVFYRHQHLQSSMTEKKRQLVVIDENSTSVLEDRPIVFSVSDVRPSEESWDLDVGDSAIAQQIRHFTEAVRATMSFNEGAPPKLPGGDDNTLYALSGRQVLHKLDEHVRSIAKTTLAKLIEDIDERILASAYQPNFSGVDISEVYMRCVPQLFSVVKRELPDYLNKDTQYPSCIHLIGGRLEIYAARHINVRHRNPVIILDATPMPELYEAMLRRSVIVHKPSIKNDNATTTVISGTDWTNSAIYREIGKMIADRNKMAQKKITALDGSVFDPSSVPLSSELYNSQIVKHANYIVKGLAERHRSLLVITHKHFREVIETIYRDPNPEPMIVKARENCKIEFGHYGALRGTNRYEDFEAVALIGAFRIPYTVAWRRISMWAWLLGIKEYIEPDTIQQEAMYDYRDEDGVMEMAIYRTFAHPFGDRYVNYLETGELEQCAARIRPHSSKEKKAIYMVANRPALPFVDLIRTKTDILQEFGFGKFGEVYEFIESEYKEFGKFPKYEIVRNKFSVSNREIAKIRKEIKTNARRSN